MVLNVYTNFFEELATDPNYEKFKKYKDDDFVIAWISSPRESNNTSLINQLSIFVYFAHTTKELVIKKEYAWGTLSRIYIGQVPLREANESGLNSISWGQYKYRKDTHKKFIFNVNSFNGFVELRTITSKYGFSMWTLNKNEASDILNETIAVYEDDRRIILVPSIVSIQAFYTMSVANSLFDALTSPQGLNKMVHRSGYTVDPKTGEKRFYVWANGDSHLVDADLITYFAQDKDLVKMFNSSALNIYNSQKIKAPIPKKGMIEIVANYFSKVQDNGKVAILITSILESNLVDDVAAKLGEVEYHHPKKLTWTKGKKPEMGPNPSGDNRKNTPGDNNLNDDKDVDRNEDSYLAFTDDMYLGSTGKTRFNINEIVAGTREKLKKQKPPKQDEVNKSPGSRKALDGDGEGKPIENNYDEEKDRSLMEVKVPDEYQLLVQGLKDEAFTVQSKMYVIPFPKGSDKGPVFCYQDNKKEKRRSFFVMRVSGKYNDNDICFFYVDVEKDKNGKRKEILIIKRDDPFKDMVEAGIQSAILDQVEKGDRKWLKDSSDEFEENEYITFMRMRKEIKVKTESEDHTEHEKLIKTYIKNYVGRMIERVSSM